MADNEYRTALRGPLLITGSASTSTVLEFGTRSGIPETSDMDANPYTTSGQTRTALIVGANLTTAMGGQKVAIAPFTTTNLATSQSGVALLFASVAGMSQLPVPFAGSVIGVAAKANANITAGTARFAVSVNGATVFSAVNSATTVSVVRGTQAINTDTISAGDAIGVKVTTSADYAPTTLEWTVGAWVEV